MARQCISSQQRKERPRRSKPSSAHKSYQRAAEDFHHSCFLIWAIHKAAAMFLCSQSIQLSEHIKTELHHRILKQALRFCLMFPQLTQSILSLRKRRAECSELSSCL
ncbi:hypothetical protein MHYP_G00040900 [Metynnis hypsauchen]